MSDGRIDYDDPEVEEAWCEERRAEVADYLRNQQAAHGQIGEWPAWHIAPYVSVWAIESSQTPGAIGGWVICGDLPTDRIGGGEADNPRDAVRSFAARWHAAAEAMMDGLACADVSIGRTADERRSLAPMLNSRAALLADWAERDDVWADIFDEG